MDFAEEPGNRTRGYLPALILASLFTTAVDTSISYPAEYAKTRLQLDARSFRALPKLGPKYYVGYSTQLWGNLSKVLVRFSAYDLCCKALADEHGQVSGLRNLFAGAITGACESVFVVAPVESLRIALIDGNRRSVNGYRDGLGIVRMAKMVYQQDGAFHGVYRGVGITVIRQTMNSSILFWSYSSAKQGLEGNLNPGEKLGLLCTFLVGSFAGGVTVLSTMPIDTIKTRIQSYGARQIKLSLKDCVVQMYDKGIHRFWGGTSMRLVKMLLTSGIQFTMFERTATIVNSISR